MRYLVPTGEQHIVGNKSVNIGTFENPKYGLPRVPVFKYFKLPIPSSYCKHCRVERAANPEYVMELKGQHRGASCEKHFIARRS